MPVGTGKAFSGSHRLYALQQTGAAHHQRSWSDARLIGPPTLTQPEDAR